MPYKYRPETKEELVEAIKKEIYEIQGTKDNPNWQADLNCIDTSLITDMYYLFSKKYGLNRFNGNISKWNVSNVENMYGMFVNSEFNQDISNWNISNVKHMIFMFVNSEFNGDIGSWPLKKDTKLENISISPEYKKFPDKIISPETIANIFIRSVKNPDNTFNINSFKQILKEYLEKHKELYKNKGYKPKIINKLILNDIADILKHIKDKNMQDKFMKIMAEKNGKEPDIEAS